MPASAAMARVEAAASPWLAMTRWAASRMWLRTASWWPAVEAMTCAGSGLGIPVAFADDGDAHHRDPVDGQNDRGGGLGEQFLVGGAHQRSPGRGGQPAPKVGKEPDGDVLDDEQPGEPTDDGGDLVADQAPCG